MKTGLAPIIDDKTEILILGSFPGEESLRAQQYYANSRNQFWKLVSAIIKEDLSTMSYDVRIAALQRHKIGLWDVFHSCDREGSLDKNITDGVLNDFVTLQQHCPHLRLICFNGQKAECSRIPLALPTVTLLSSSPANAIPFERKIAQWRALLG